MKCSIVLSSFNNEGVIKQSLNALYGQAVPEGWHMQVLICDDGSSDATVALAREAAVPEGWDARVHSFPHKGPGAVRNGGIDRSDGDIILFLQADTLLRPGALREHLNFHSAHPDKQMSALGWVMWDPRINPSPLMEWMTHGGPQNDYDSLLGRNWADPRHFWYGAHFSVKRAALEEVRFSADFKGYGWEDLDLGRRMAKKGAKLRVLHNAVALHHHYYSPGSVIARQYKSGLAYPVFQNRHPRAGLLPRRSHWHRLKIRFAVVSGAAAALNAMLKITGPHLACPKLFLYATSLSFWRGVYKNKTISTS